MDTDLLLIDFSSLLQDILLNRFYYVLPPSVLDSFNKDSEDKSSVTVPSKRKRENVAETERNLDLVQDWKLRSEESYETVFRNKTVEGPMLSLSSKPCLKYHVNGICYSDCKYKRSHQKISMKDDIDKTSKFIKSLRGE